MPTIADYLKYANLQMAAEAFIRNEITNILADSGQPLIDALISGNGHASRFTETEATNFTDQWEVVDQRANTKTGFSGTLFKAIKDNPELGIHKDDLVLSFRSTEFIDDAIRDSAATNKLEVFDTGWAWGQMADMEAWYKELTSTHPQTGERGALLGKTYSVTGYSLGGHLATAFNLLRREEAALGPLPATLGEVVTFNGAGVGEVKTGTLQQALDYFNALRTNPESIRNALAFTVPELAAFYETLRANMANQTWTAGQARDALRALDLSGAYSSELQIAAVDEERRPLDQALTDIITLQNERARIAGFTKGGDEQDAGSTPKPITSVEILAETLDYRLAVYFASQKTDSKLSVLSKTPGNPPLTNQTDLVGKETTQYPWSAVANSGVHYGTNVDLFIEDQPLVRGDFLEGVVKGLPGINLLHDRYALNNFSDSHSIVLIVDSLAVQNTLLNLVPADKRKSAAATLQSILLQASWRKAESTLGGQGQAEGDVLENVVNALADLFLGPQPKAARLNGSPDGNTWARTDASFTTPDGKTYTGREALYEKLKNIVGSAGYKTFAANPTLTLEAATGDIATRARSEFGAFAALYSLSPFVLKGDGEAIATAVGSAWQDTYNDWKSDRDAHAGNDASHEDTITDQWLIDRAIFLHQKNVFNAANKTPYNPDAVESDGSAMLADASFEDVASGYKIQQGRLEGSSASRTYFGAEEADTFTGGDYADHLYGGAGDDTLDGGKGADYLEGNADNDTLTGGEGADTLLGGSGDDTLEGGKDNDALKGGKGADTYKYTSGDGWDTIEDSNGLGKIEYDNVTLTTADYISPNVWQKTDDATQKTFTYILVDWTENGETTKRLSIQGPDGGLFIKGWKNGDLGLTLPGAPADSVPPTQSADLTLLGDLAPIDFGPEPGVQPQYDALGNVIVHPQQAQPDRADTLYDSAGNDLIQSGGGDDTLRAERGGNDTLEAGSGDDRLYAGAGDDRLKGESGSDLLRGQEGADILEGGADSDILLGDTGKDEVFADAHQGLQAALAANAAGTGGSSLRGEWLDGNAGEDLVVGGENADVLFGGGDKDTLIGGAGNDNLFGDDETAYVYRTWSLTRSTEAVGSILTVLKSSFADGYFAAAPESGVPQDMLAGDDRIFGGAGEDWIQGNAGDDMIDGGADNDAAWGDEGSDVLVGGTGNDILYGDSFDLSTTSEALAAGLVGIAGSLHGSDYLDGGEGDDNASGNGGDDQVYGGAGNDTLGGDDGLTPGQYHGNDIVDGGAGNDTIWGHGGADELSGGDGDDHIEGDLSGLDKQYHGRDLVFGGKGKDEIIGGGDDDELHGGDDDDSIVGDDTADGPLAADAHGRDTLYGEKGDDFLSGGGGDDKLYGGEGKDGLHGDGDTVANGGNDMLDGGDNDDYLSGNGGNDTLLGGAGDDGLHGDAGNDLLVGGAGTDALLGGDGEDIYRFAAGDSPENTLGQNESIDDAAGSNTVVFESATLDDLTVRNSSGYLDITYGANDCLLIAGGFAGSIATYEFANGERLSYSELIGRLTDGVSLATTTGGQQIASGGRDNNTLDLQTGGALISGGRGNDSITGNGGGNTYLYSLGDGTDTIADTSRQNGFTAQNTLRFGAGIKSSDIKLGLGSLLIRVGSHPDDAIHIEGFNPGDALGQPSIDRFEFADGTVLTQAELLARGFDLEGTANADTITGTSVADRIAGKEGNDTLVGGDGDDLLTGGAGDDMLSGGAGNDTYVWGSGDGQDTIDNLDNSAGRVDTLRIAGALLPADLSFAHSGNDLIVRIRNTADQMVVRNHYTSAPIDAIAFSDGSLWDRAAINAHVTNELTDGADIYAGTAGADSIDGRGGNDVLSGLGGNDAIQGGDGNDTLSGNEGNDTYVFRSGDGLPSADGAIESITDTGGAEVARFEDMGLNALKAANVGSGMCAFRATEMQNPTNDNNWRQTA